MVYHVDLRIDLNLLVFPNSYLMLNYFQLPLNIMLFGHIIYESPFLLSNL